MDSCLSDVGPPDPLPFPILLNIITCGVCTVMWILVAWCDRDHAYSFPSTSSYGLAFGTMVQYLSIMGITLSLPVLLIFYLADPVSELACQTSVLNNIGVVPWGLITAVFPFILLAFDLARESCTRYILAERMVHAIVHSPGRFTGQNPHPPPSILILPAGATRGLFIAPLIHRLRTALLHSSGSWPRDEEHQGTTTESMDDGEHIPVRVYLADAWGTAWQPSTTASVLHNLACDGEKAGVVEIVDTSFVGTTAVPSTPASLDAILIPYSKQIVAINSAEKVEDRVIRLLHFLDSCATALRPDGTLAVGVLRGNEAAIYSAVLAAVGFTDVILHAERIWLSPSPVSILTARIPADGRRNPLPLSSNVVPLPSPPSLQPPRSWFPSGSHWRARDITVSLTWTVVALLTWLASANLSRLLIPTFVTWGSTVGTLALSSALFGPSCAFYTTVELTTFAAGQANSSAYSRHGKRKSVRMEGEGQDDHNGDEKNTLLDEPEQSAHGTYASNPPEPSATDVWSRWLTFELPIFAANIGIFQIIFWLPAFAVDAAVLKVDGRTGSAEADLAVNVLSYGLLGLFVAGGMVWFVQRGRKEKRKALEMVRMVTEGT